MERQGDKETERFSLQGAQIRGEWRKGIPEPVTKMFLGKVLEQALASPLAKPTAFVHVTQQFDDRARKARAIPITHEQPGFAAKHDFTRCIVGRSNAWFFFGHGFEVDKTEPYNTTRHGKKVGTPITIP